MYTDRIRSIMEAGEILRFHAVPAIPAQSVARHSWGVAMMATAICSGTPCATILMGCLLHDTGELITGDIPFTAKRDVFLHLKDELDAAEATAMDSYLWGFPTLNVREETIVKLADMLEGLRYADLNERFRPGGHPVVADRWWHALHDMFCKKAVWSLSEQERDQAYTLFRHLSPTLHNHRLPGSFSEFARRHSMRMGQDAAWVEAKSPPPAPAESAPPPMELPESHPLRFPH